MHKTSSMRIEKDFLGAVEIPYRALYGINSHRAKENFPNDTPFHKEWYGAMGKVKLACYQTYKNFKQAAMLKYKNENLPIEFFSDEMIEALITAAGEISESRYFEHFIVPAVQGGAGTSINMNINEIVSNVALTHIGKKPGDYHIIDPIEQANIYQSTNDIVPTSLIVASMDLLVKLEESINKLRFGIEELEKSTRNELRIGYTQMQEAVPSSYGRLFSTYNEALSRDWWRVSKCSERIKVVNLGGSAIGTSVSVPRFFVMEVVPTLQKITGLPVTRSENLSDATCNLDTFVEVHATMKSHAVNLEKMVSDLRLLSSDLLQNKEMEIPKKQIGSSIMPGKVNPVIPEFVISSVHKIYANDMLISNLCGQGCLELNAYIPVIGHALIESLKLLIAANNTMHSNLITGLLVHKGIATDKLYHSPAITTALMPYIGYHRAGELAKVMKEKGLSVFEANKSLKILDDEKLSFYLKPENLLKSGYSLKELL